MTLESTLNKNRYVGNGYTTQFPFSFKVWKPEQILVFTGNGETEQDVSAQCTVNITASGGTVSFSTAPAPGTIVVIRRNMPFIQEDDYRNGTRFDSEEVEDRFDQDCAERQDLRLDVGRAVKVPETSSKTPEEWWADFVRMVGDVEEAKALIWQWLQAIGTDHVGNTSLVMAEGSTAWRTLASRFGDIVNVKDFGAQGNGTTDDTAAFAAAAATGRPVFVPKGTYNVTQKVNGYFWSIDNVVIPFTRVWCEKYYQFEPRDFTGTASSIGGDYPNLGGDYTSQQWDRATQAGCCDVYDSVLYIPQQDSSGSSFISVIRWSEKESERVMITRSNGSYGLVCHQCLNVYRPNLEDEPVFICAASKYTDPGTTDATRNFTVNFLRYNYRADTTPQLIKSMPAFDGSGLDSDVIMNVACSPDGAVMVASARTTGGQYKHRVWDLHAVMMGKYDSLLDSYLYEWTSTEGAVVGGQGTWTDGRYIYSMSGGSDARGYSTGVRFAMLKVQTLDGKLLGQYYVNTTYGDKSFFAGHALIGEFEGMFLAPWQGKLVPVLMSSQMWHNDDEDLTLYKRYNRYCLPTVSINSSEEIVAGNLTLQGEIHAMFPTETGVNQQSFSTQRILFYAPTGTGDVNLVVGAEGGASFCAGEIITAMRSAYQQAAINDQHIATEALRLLSDGRIVLHSGALPTDDFLEDDDRLAGFHVNNANNFFFYNSSPLAILAYKNASKGTAPDSTQHSRLAFGSNATSASEDYYYAAIYHNLFSDNSQRLDIGVYPATAVGSALNHSLALQHDPATGFVNKMQASLLPWNGNTFDIGSDSARWDNGYFHTSVAAESDERVKQQIEDLSEAEKRVAIRCKGLIKKYKFNEAVEKKGEGARIHCGVIAQQIKAAFEAEGLNAEKYGLLCHASWDDEYEERVVSEDENGNILETERVLVRPAGDGFSVRYEELLCFIIASL